VTTLRDGTADDALVLVSLQKEASVTAFAHVFPPDRYPFPEEAVLDDLHARLSAGSELVVAEKAHGTPVGWAAVAPGWLEQLYVLPAWWGRGVGPLLHDAAVARRRAAGDELLLLWTLEANARSRRFYERRGWRLDGRTRSVPYPPYPLDVGYALDLTTDPT
jgi:GNAT superfamily N-acetyltransferase